MRPSSVIDELSHRNPLPVEGDAPANLSTDARDLLRAIVSTPRDHTAATAVVPRRHRARTRRILSAGAVAGLAAASLVLAGVFSTSNVVGPPTISHPQAVAVLDAAYKAAIAQPNLPALAAGEYYYERNIDSNVNLCQLRSTSSGKTLFGGAGVGNGPTFNYVQQTATERWSTSAYVAGYEVTPIGEGHFYTAAQQAAWEQDGSPSVTDCADPAPPGLQTVAPPTSGSNGVGSLPTDPATLGALIAAGRVNDAGQVTAGDGQCPSKAGDAAQIYPQGAVCSVSAQFDIATNLLDAPEGPQLVGPALYKILSQLPSVEEIGTSTDALGRAGTAIEDPSTRTIFVVDPTTGALLEQQTLLGSSKVSEELSPDVSPGTVVSSITYGPLEVVAGRGERPAAANTGTTGNTGTGHDCLVMEGVKDAVGEREHGAQRRPAATLTHQIRLSSSTGVVRGCSSSLTTFVAFQR